MKAASWATLGLSRVRMCALVVSVGAVAAAAVLATTFGLLGGISIVLAAAVGAASSYLVASAPKRSLDRSALLQAREAPALAASSAVYLQSTGSRAKTVMMLHSDESRLQALFERAKRSTLLGFDAPAVLEAGESVRADSTAGILSSVARAQGERLADGGEELEGIVRASLSAEETKFPVFLTVSFFLPIMLMLLAAVGRHDDPVSVVSLMVLEIFILDLALSFTSTERRRLSA
ncbi:MAG: hypothetical protein OK449_04235 [Thaumarchaeota archaeon]|nr:hypothetical protein [Nitrososphaerota archaeon]